MSNHLLANPASYPLSGSDSSDVSLGYEIAKRGLDILVSSVTLLVLTPVFFVIACVLKLSDRGDVFYVSDRVGRNGRVFKCVKFRSMVMDAEQKKDDVMEENQHENSITFKAKNDSRITPFGRVLRKYSLDELPQFWNVLIGDMSIVGPRPAIPREVDLYSEADYTRLDVVPGLTCIWQVSGRGDIPFDEQVSMDLEYIANRSFGMDLKLILKTFPVVISGEGAY